MAKRTVNKSKFVREHSGPAKEVVAAAKKAGFKLSEKYVYNIRAKAKANGVVKPKKVGRPAGSTRRAAQGAIEAAFKQTVLEIGLLRAAQLMDEVRSTKVD